VVTTRNDIDATGKDERTLGEFLTDLREKRGFSRDQVNTEARIPKHYIVMMESDDYSLIADQLYMMPFLRRYAAFLGLEPDDVATRFVREIQRSESSVVRISERIVSARQRNTNRWRIVAIGLAAVLILVAAIEMYARSRRHAPPVPPSSSAAPGGGKPLVVPAIPAGH
jgi:cytoskeletal protein RodZ